MKKVEKIASNIGFAFQVQDDILDVTSTSEVLGKPVHSDEKNEKSTYVTLVGLAEAGRLVESASMERWGFLESFPEKTGIWRGSSKS